MHYLTASASCTHAVVRRDVPYINDEARRKASRSAISCWTAQQSCPRSTLRRQRCGRMTRYQAGFTAAKLQLPGLVPPCFVSRCDGDLTCCSRVVAGASSADHPQQCRGDPQEEGCRWQCLQAVQAFHGRRTGWLTFRSVSRSIAWCAPCMRCIIGRN